MPVAKRILVVDDEVSFLSFLKEALEIRGFEVITVSNAIEAGIELAAKQPSLILMDIKMPGIDGIEACEAIKRNRATKNIPIVIVSALHDESYKRQAKKIGVADYFVKPVDIEAFIKRISEIIS